MVRDDFWLDTDNALQHGIHLQKEIEFDPVEPNVESVSVPGRSGDLHYFDGSYKNVRGIATCYCLDYDVAKVVTAVNAWALKSVGYRRLETLTEPHFYRMARLRGGAKFEPRGNRINPFTLEFDCMPQKFYKFGEEPIDLQGPTSIYSPSPFPALPLIVVHGTGSGSLTIGGSTMTLDNVNELTLDCEAQRAYSGSTNRNSTVHGEYFKLLEENAVSWSGGITSVIITPRWWTV